MASEIELLLEKYWQGETTLEEERKIKKYLSSHKNISPEARYFQAVVARKSVKADSIPLRNNRFTRMSVAASVAVGILVAFFVVKDAQTKEAFVVDDPQQALEITRNALMMVSSGLKEGNTYSLELKKINKAKQNLKETKN